MKNCTNIPTTISGPINVVRMEGIIFGIKKVIYLFMDTHLPLGTQTKCPDFMSQDVVQYLATNFKNSDKPLDFMFEIKNSWINNESVHDYTSMYIHDFVNLFLSEYSTKDGKVNSSRTNSLIRYHYLDIRDYIYGVVMQYDYHIHSILNNYLAQNISHNVITLLTDSLSGIITELLYWKEIFNGDISEVQNATKKNLKRLLKNKKKIDIQIDEVKIEKDIKEIPKFMYKIKGRYNHPEIKSKLKILFNEVISSFDEIIDMCNVMKSNLAIFSEKIIDPRTLYYHVLQKAYNWGQPYTEKLKLSTDLIIEYLTISNKLTYVYAIVTDIYFLRRFLDKDYIKNAIVYSGALHSVNYIQHLLTQHDFKITNCSYSLEKNLDKLNMILKNIDSLQDLTEYEKMLFPPRLLQCSDLTGFPENFN